jgi:hypothetical protein
MTGILDRIRNTTVADLENVTGSFDDVAPAVYRPRVAREMTRIVEGATDLRPAVAMPNMNAGTVGGTKIDDRPFQVSVEDRRSERQAELMDSLLGQLEDLDHDTAVTAREYTDGMTSRGLWTSGMDGNASRWIGNMIAKVRELKAAARVEVPVAATTSIDPFADVPDGYYAVADGEGVIKFYRVTTGGPDSRYAGVRFLKVQASDEFHPIRNRAIRTSIFTTIRTVGVQASMALYGQHIGRCGRCHRTLTDADSRARGIGPDCLGKM